MFLHLQGVSGSPHKIKQIVPGIQFLLELLKLIKGIKVSVTIYKKDLCIYLHEMCTRLRDLCILQYSSISTRLIRILTR